MNYRTFFSLALMAFAGSLGFAACTNTDVSPTDVATDPDKTTTKTAKSSVSRNESPDVSEEVQTFASANADFAFNLYRNLDKKSANIVYSPTSASMALAMTYAGANGQTATEMASALQFKLPQNKLHAAFNKLDLELAKRNASWDAEEKIGFVLHTANSLWGQDGLPFLPPFLDTVSMNYGAGMNLVDFTGAAESARSTIDGWVSAKTEKKIPELLMKDDVDASTRLVLVNAIYFKASWLSQFQTSRTAPATFHGMNGDEQVDMMAQEGSFAYAESPEWQAFELPFTGNSVGMTIVLPAEGKLEAVESSLSSEWLKNLDQAKAQTALRLAMPKFKFDSRHSLGTALEAMGMKQAFSDNADFSGIVAPSNSRLMIAKVIQAATLDLDEGGAEAAASTAVIMVDGSCPMNQKSVSLDRPFLFLIRDYSTNAILFAGRVGNPSAPASN